MRRAALDLRVEGVVQGVGFRPFVYRLAERHRLDGWVCNAAGDVRIEIEGARDELDQFLRELEAEAPALARIERVEATPRAPRGLEGFRIVASTDDPGRRPPVSPDAGICPACEAELADPANRRFRYPFITCTDCGPRFTVITAMPYDRERTSMAPFTQCPACAAEYATPSDRRYHCETNSCPACGPRLWFTDGHGMPAALGTDEALEAAGALLRCGGILALRGLGGFHLAVDATDGAAVHRLRGRKHRDAKPLAVMVLTLDDAERVGSISPEEAALLRGPERPIVLLEARCATPLCDAVAPGLTTVGVMLPSTPLHRLLLRAAGRPLVMTSGNRSEEPIATGNAEAVARLGGIADGFLLHDREIVARYDDSVARWTPAGTLLLRRARGHAPSPLALPIATPLPLVAVGPHLKNTFTLAQDGRAFVSQHIGDLENLETLTHFQDALARARALFRVDPEIAVRDLHPGYLSTRLAEELDVGRVLAVQHHHAHVAAVMAEHGVTEPVIGVAFDGTGYGGDGCIWGGEVLVADLTGYRRAAHLRYAPLPGGDLAARRPWRSALGYLSLEPGAEPAFALALFPVSEAEREAASRQIARGINSPLASSMGRLFDAAAAVIGLRHVAGYEGQAAMELEALAGRRIAGELRWGANRESDGCLILDPLPVLAALGARRQRGADLGDLAADFHASVAWAAANAVQTIVTGTGIRTVALGGGVFQNARLFASLAARLQELGLRVLLPRRLGPNDGAISYGQAAVAAAVLRA